jgi:hypothetical protein
LVSSINGLSFYPCYRLVAILLGRLRLRAEQALVHLAELGQSVFLEPNESGIDYEFDIKRLRTSVTGILGQYGSTETTKMIDDTVAIGQTFV